MRKGIGQGRITGNLEGAPIDRQYRISDDEGLEQVAALLRDEGLCLGLSSGINVAGAVRLARDLGPGQDDRDDPLRYRLSLSVVALQSPTGYGQKACPCLLGLTDASRLYRLAMNVNETPDVIGESSRRMQRIRVGITGLAAIVLVVLLATAIASGLNRRAAADHRADRRPGSCPRSMLPKKRASHSAQLGVAPDAKDTARSRIPRGPKRNNDALATTRLPPRFWFDGDVQFQPCCTLVIAPIFRFDRVLGESVPPRNIAFAATRTQTACPYHEL